MTKPNSVGAHADILLAGTAEINRWRNENPGTSMDLRSVRAADSELSGALLKNADLSGAIFRNCKFVGARFDSAILTNTQFIDCDLSKATFCSADVTTTQILNSILDESDFSGTRGFSQIAGIETCRVSNRHVDVSFNLINCRPLDHLLSWGKIRAIGQLRLFIPSYAALSISIVVLTSLGFLNERLGVIRDLVESLIDKGILSSVVGIKIIEAAQPWRSSWRHLAVLASTSGIALGATLYLFCPSRVKEFTLDQWSYLVDRPSFEYHVQTWALPRVRLWCVIAYGFGGVIAAVLLGETFLRAVVLIITGLTS